MAKSLRSKWKRKMRAVKRKRYAVKELAKLKQVVGADGKELLNDEEMKELVTVTDAQKIRKDKEEQAKETEAAEAAEGMDVDGTKFNSRTMKDENGQYPVWMNKRAIQKQRAKNNKRGKVAKGASATKKGKKKGVIW